MAPRTLGPLRDAALESGGPLAAAFADDRPVDGVFTAVMAELAAAPPTALVVEDVHWADDATHRRARLRRAADRAGARRARPQLPRRRARPVASAPAPAGRAWPGARCGGWRCRRSRARRCGGWRRARAPTPTPCTASPAATRSSSPRCWPRPPTPSPPPSSRRCSPASAASTPPAARRSSSSRSCPRGSGSSSPATLLGDRIDTLAEAELAGVLEVSAQPSRLPPRAGAARDRAQPAGARAAAPERAASCDALQREQRPDRASLMHFAVEAGDVETVLAVGPDAAREAARAGSHRQALAHLESVRPHLRGSASASARPCSTTTAGSSTTRTASARRWTPGGRRPRCTSGSTTRSPSPTASCACRATCSWRARRSRPRSARTGPWRSSSRPATPPRSRRRRCTAARSSRSPTSSSGRPGMLELARDLAAARRPRRPRGARAQLPRGRGRRARRPRRPAARARQPRGRARRGRPRGRRPRLLQRRGAAVPRGAARPSWRRASPRACRSRASAGSGRTPTTSSCTAACCSCAAATSTARSRACASWSTASRTRGCCSPTACPGSAARWRGAATRRRAGCWPGPGTARSASGCCSASPTRAWPRWSGRGWPGGRRSPSASRPRSRRGSRTPAPRRSGPS